MTDTIHTVRPWDVRCGDLIARPGFKDEPDDEVAVQSIEHFRRHSAVQFVDGVRWEVRPDETLRRVAR